MDQSRVIMFPGLGASYPNMIEKYLLAHPDDAQFVERWAGYTGVFKGDTPLMPTPIVGAEINQQFAIHLMNLLWWRRAPVADRTAAVCGHSLGYYAALVAVGVITEEESFALIAAVFDGSWDRFSKNDKAVYVLTTKEEIPLAELTDNTPIELLSDNNPLQRVLYGDKESCDALFKRIKEKILRVVELGIKVPFHSTQMNDVLASVSSRVATLDLKPRPLERQLWSHITARPITTSTEALGLVLEQLCQPVQWNLLVDRLIQAGRFDFFEIGPNRVLSQIVRWINPNLGVQFVDNLRR
jgi:[acyl-carrier-protein] S-malonyltransferase